MDFSHKASRLTTTYTEQLRFLVFQRYRKSISAVAGMIFIQNALPLLIKRGEEVWLCRKLGSLEAVCFIGWTFTVTNDDSFYFYTPHSSERDPEIQHCHSGWLAQRGFLFKITG